MAHFSEMEFLFVSSPRTTTSTDATKNINNSVGNNERSIYSIGSGDESQYVFKGPWGSGKREKGIDNLGLPNERKIGYQGEQVKNYAKNAIYNNGTNNPYVDLINNFDGRNNSAKSLMIKASDLAYLRELGVYPINRMVILRRFQEGQAVPEKLDELNSIPMSTVIGWLKEDENFGNFAFNESWTQTNKRLISVPASGLEATRFFFLHRPVQEFRSPGANRKIHFLNPSRPSQPFYWHPWFHSAFAVPSRQTSRAYP